MRPITTTVHESVPVPFPGLEGEKATIHQGFAWPSSPKSGESPARLLSPGKPTFPTMLHTVVQPGQCPKPFTRAITAKLAEQLGLRSMQAVLLWLTLQLTAAQAQTVYQNNFEVASNVGSEWQPASFATTPKGARRFLGRFANEGTTLSLANLPTHSAVTVSFDLLVIQSWDGSNTGFGPDLWEWSVGGERTLLRATFSNSNDGSLRQSYPDCYPYILNPGGTGAAERNTLGFPIVQNYSGGTDSVYRMTNTFAHSGGRLLLRFGAGGLESEVNESWGLDNVVVAVSQPPGGVVEWSAPVFNIGETNSVATVQVRRSGATNLPISVAFETASGTAIAGADFAATSGVLEFAAGEALKTLSIPLLDDTSPENDESFVVTLRNPSNGAVLGLPSRAWVTIQDDERPNPVFERVESGPLVSSSGALAAAWGDFNGDGNDDVFIPNWAGGRNSLLRGNGDGTFTAITSGSVVSEGGSSTAGAWADYDNDGDLDLFVTNFGANFLYRNNGNGIFTKVTAGAVVSEQGSWQGCAWGDYDNDGWVDLFAVNDAGNNALYRNNRNGTFTRVTTGSPVRDGGASTSCAWGDYDGDGWLDLIVVNRSGQKNFLYRNNRDGTFAKITSGAVVTDVGDSYGVAWADYDNDGDFDLLVTNFDGANFLYRNDAGVLVRVTLGSLARSTGFCLTPGWGDFNNDGLLDAFISTVAPGGMLFRNDGISSGTITFSRITQAMPARELLPSSSVTWPDANNDGYPDLFVPTYSGLNNGLYLAKPSTNHWLKLRCLGALSNRAGIGAEVRVRAMIGGEPRWQTRAIGGGNGSNQDGLIASVGLGDAARADLVEIRWPSGLIQRLRNIAADQSLTIREALSLEPLPNPGEFQIEGRTGLRYRVETSSDLQTWTEAAVLTNELGSVRFTDPKTDGYVFTARSCCRERHANGERAVAKTLAVCNDVVMSTNGIMV